MTIMPNTVAKAVRWPIRAFTLSGSVTAVFRQVENQLFYLRFEYLYRDSQRLAQAQGKPIELSLSSDKVTNGQTTLALPKDITLDQSRRLIFDAKGGNSSLVKITFTSDKEVVSYQLNMGSGKYKKTVS